MRINMYPYRRTVKEETRRYDRLVKERIYPHTRTVKEDTYQIDENRLLFEFDPFTLGNGTTNFTLGNGSEIFYLIETISLVP
jgi:hypothetical protein